MLNKTRFHKIVIFGAGHVGSQIAATIIDLTLATHICLFDPNKKLLLAQLADLRDRIINYSNKLFLTAGKLSDLHDADLVVVACGVHQKPGQIRDELAEQNAIIVQKIVQQLQEQQFAGFIIVVTNPVDQITFLVHKLTNWPKHKIIGTATGLDTLRLQHVVQKTLSVNLKLQDFTVLGEHGVNLFLPSAHNQWINQIGNNQTEHITNFINLVLEIPNKMIVAKGATYFGISKLVAEIAKQLLNRSGQTWNLGVWEKNCVIGHPALINKQGVQMVPINLTNLEKITYQKLCQIAFKKQNCLWKRLKKVRKNKIN